METDKGGYTHDQRRCIGLTRMWAQEGLDASEKARIYGDLYAMVGECNL